MEIFLSIIDNLKSWIRTLFTVAFLLSFFGINWATSILCFSAYVLAIFSLYDLILLIRSAVLLFLFEGDTDEILGFIGTILELLVFVAVIILVIIILTSGFAFSNDFLLNFCFIFSVAMLLHSWIVEILSLPLSIIGIFIDD